MLADPASTESGIQETETVPGALCQGLIFAFSYMCQFVSLINDNAKIAKEMTNYVICAVNCHLKISS